MRFVKKCIGLVKYPSLMSLKMFLIKNYMDNLRNKQNLCV